MTATDTYLLLRAFCDELGRCGMTDACTSPGSRSAPLVLSLVREPRLRTWSHIDERCAGFFAIGLAKQTQRPVAVATTSGTAAAELSPAVHEAREGRVPLLLLTADRPPELREVGAGQTIDQVKLYGSAAKWFVEVGTHEATPARLRWIRALACRAYWTTLEGRPGVVHLNFPLREPLVPDGALPDDDTGRPGSTPQVARVKATAPATESTLQNLAKLVDDRRRGVIVCGRLDAGPGFGRAVARLAVATGYPVLADPLSGARVDGVAVAHYDALLRHEDFARAQVPELVLRLGDLPTSKPLREWLASTGAQVAVDPEQTLHDPDAAVTIALAADPASAVAELTERVSQPPDTDWTQGWRDADRAAASAIERTLGGELSEPRVATELGRHLPSAAPLVVASSMPVRDVETFFPARAEPPRVLSNRGANGIDGTVSTAFGVAAGADGPVVLLIGDVALAHDVGGLLAASRLGLKITIVLLNNNGGGIFHFLPVASQTDAFEEHVATPTGLNFARAAALYGCGYELIQDVDSLGVAAQRALAAPYTTILEVRSDRNENVALHRLVWDAVADAL